MIRGEVDSPIVNCSRIGDESSKRWPHHVSILADSVSRPCEKSEMPSMIAKSDGERIPFWSALVRDRRIAPALGLGFTSGMPFLLTYSTQSAWLTDAGVPLATIGLLSELTLAYKFKFVWAPFLDQYDPPFVGRMLGRRRGWLVVAILAVMAILGGIAFGDPGHRIWWTVEFSLALGIAARR